MHPILVSHSRVIEEVGVGGGACPHLRLLSHPPVEAVQSPSPDYCQSEAICWPKEGSRLRTRATSVVPEQRSPVAPTVACPAVDRRRFEEDIAEDFDQADTNSDPFQHNLGLPYRPCSDSPSEGSEIVGAAAVGDEGTVVDEATAVAVVDHIAAFGGFGTLVKTAAAVSSTFGSAEGNHTWDSGPERPLNHRYSLEFSENASAQVGFAEMAYVELEIEPSPSDETVIEHIAAVASSCAAGSDAVVPSFDEG